MARHACERNSVVAHNTACAILRSTIPEEPLVFANFQSENMTPTYAAVAEDVGQRLNRKTELIEGTSLDQLRHGTVDVAIVCGLPYVTLESESPGVLTLLAAPILADERVSDRPVYFSDVVVLADSRFQRFDDLRGARWAHTDPGSFSGYVATRYHLAAIGQSEAFFGQVAYARSHRRALAMVIAGEVDAAAIDSHVLAVERRTDPRLDRLRVIASFGPAPIPPVVATRRLPPSDAERVKQALYAMGADPRRRTILEGGAIRGFAPVSDADYDDIRRKQALVERSAAPV